MSDAQRILQDARRIVVKVGSSLVTNEGRGLDEPAIGEWCRQIAALMRSNDKREIIMVSSGAIAEGMKRLGWSTLPRWAKWVWRKCMKANCVSTVWAARRCC